MGELRTDRPAGPGPQRTEQAVRRVLVVDDSRPQRRLVAASLSRWGYQVQEAASGEAALAICRHDPPEIVLSDWMMPGMTGPDFCRALRHLPHDRYIYFILLTSISEKDAVARGLDHGADDLLTKPVSGPELRARIHAGERILRMQAELTEKNRIITETLSELRALYDDIDRDLMQARKIQQALMPPRSQWFGRARVSTLLRPCGHVGGDMVGVFRAGETRLGLYSIDVAGHGITSAMTAARIGGYLSPVLPDHNIGLERRYDRFFALRPPAEVAALLNRRLLADAAAADYFTMAYATVDVATGRGRLVQAGHPPPLLIRAGGDIQPLGEGGLPIGLIDRARHDEIALHLGPGDRLLLYSDGVTETRLQDGLHLDTAGLIALLRECLGRRDGPDLLDRMHAHLAERALSAECAEDDLSAILLELDPPGRDGS